MPGKKTEVLYTFSIRLVRIVSLTVSEEAALRDSVPSPRPGVVSYGSLMDRYSV